MSNSEKKDIFPILTDIYRDLGETKAIVDRVDERLSSHIKFSLEELNKINELDAEQNRILDKHIEGVNTLKKMYIAHRDETKQQIELLRESLSLQKDEHDKRINSLEKPYDLLKLIGKVSVWACGIVSLVYVSLQVAIILGVL